MMQERVALELDPNYQNPLFIATHFLETIGQFVQATTDRKGEIQSAQWKGVGDFDKRENQTAFGKAYSEKQC